MKLIVNETIREKISELKFSIIKKSFELNKKGEMNMNIKQ